MTGDNMDAHAERVLAGLRAVEPGRGMEDRVLLRARQEASNAAERHDTTRKRWMVAMGFSTAAVLLGLLAPAHRGNWGRVSPAEDPQRQKTAAAQEEAMRPAIAPAENVTVNVGQGARIKAHPVRPAHAIGATATEDDESASGQLVSYPAPIMPLTRQERLLLRMLRGGEQSTLIATLSPQAEQATELQKGRQRLSFFAPPQKEREAERKRVGIQDDDLVVDPVGHTAPAMNQSETEF